MIIKRIDENTISCTITPEDMREEGIRLDDLFERKKEAVDFIRHTVARVVREEKFDLQGELTTMRLTVLPDHSVNLLITRDGDTESAQKEIRKIARSLLESIAAKAAAEAGKSDSSAKSGEEAADIMKTLLSAAPEETVEEKHDGEQTADAYMFSFYSVRDAMDCCKVFANLGPVDSSFYYLREDDVYFLILRRRKDTPSDFARMVLSANEFGELITSEEQYISFVKEHGICILADHCLEMFTDTILGARDDRSRTEA